MELKYACLQPKFCPNCGQYLDWKLLQDNASLTIMNLIHQETEKELKERLKDNETTKLS